MELLLSMLMLNTSGKPSGNESPLFDSDMVKAVFVQIVQLLGSSNIEIALKTSAVIVPAAIYLTLKDPHTRKKFGWGILAAHLVSTIIFMIPNIFRGGRSIKEVDVFDRLDDLKGVDQLKIELKEIVYCASDPKGFIQLGGKFPQSVLLVGLPGSGKKMSARAIAREAGVHFFPCNARVLQESEYDAEWVKEMFKDAKRSPCVVFIDEIDAIGQNPKDQSLKQVIDELNGIRENEKIIVIGATNNPNALDMSPLRHGLFDRRIIIPYPDIDGRRKILESHLSKVPSADDVDVITFFL
ncbi:hypothetical protein P8452_19676 [Trifolium repens]|nr:hypothetical protein P8452_19676 [Trifolium repens]